MRLVYPFNSFFFFFSVPRCIDSGKGTGIWQHYDIQKLIEWAKEANIDPNNPDYLDLIEIIMVNI